MSVWLLMDHKGETGRELQGLTEHLRRICEAFKGVGSSTSDATKAIAYMQAVMNEDWRRYRPKWARKRTPRYLAKGGVRK